MEQIGRRRRKFLELRKTQKISLNWENQLREPPSCGCREGRGRGNIERYESKSQQGAKQRSYKLRCVEESQRLILVQTKKNANTSIQKRFKPSSREPKLSAWRESLTCRSSLSVEKPWDKKWTRPVKKFQQFSPEGKRERRYYVTEV